MSPDHRCVKTSMAMHPIVFEIFQPGPRWWTNQPINCNTLSFCYYFGKHFQYIVFTEKARRKAMLKLFLEAAAHLSNCCAINLPHRKKSNHTIGLYSHSHFLISHSDICLLRRDQGWVNVLKRVSVWAFMCAVLLLFLKALDMIDVCP